MHLPTLTSLLRHLAMVVWFTAATIPIADAAPVTYKVKSGDTVWGIARKHKVKAADLKELNHLKSNLIRTGQVLRVPQTGAGPTAPASRLQPVATKRSTKSGGRTVIILDPGHGGKDPGAVYGGTREKDLNLIVARRCRELLAAHGYLVKMTRHDDRFLSLTERAAFCNAHDKAIIISIHFNAWGKSRSAQGIETFYASAVGRKLAGHVHSNVLRSVNQKDRGIKLNSKYKLLTKTKHPTALVELGFMSNPTELRMIRSSAMNEKRAQGIVRGIRAYFGYL